MPVDLAIDERSSMIPSTHRVVMLQKFGGPEGFVVVERPVPEPGVGEVLVKVLAASVQFTDVILRKGRYHDLKEKPPLVLGYDLVGEIVKLGPGVTSLAVGQRVADLTMTGSYAQYRTLDATQVALVHAALDPAVVTSLVLSWMTGYQLLHRNARVLKGQTILVLGAAGAVGQALLILGKLAGCTVWGAARARVRSYDAVVIGGALYAFRWQPDAFALVLNNVAALREKQVWFFSSGPLDESASAHEIPPVPQVEQLMAHVGARGHVTFGGRLAADATGMAAGMAKTHSGDWRAPDRIDAWARDLAAQLRADPLPARLAFKPLSSRTLAVALCLLSGISALFGGAVLVARPDGSILGIPLSVLAHSPFHDFLVPGLVLFTVIGLGTTWAAWLHARRAQNAAFASLLAGVALAGWIIVESILLRSFVSLQIAYLVLGLVMIGESLRQLRRIFPPGAGSPAPQPGHAAAGT